MNKEEDIIERFYCEKCGVIDTITTSLFQGDIDKYITINEDGKEEVEFCNDDFEENDGYRCGYCGNDVEYKYIKVNKNTGEIINE